MFCVNKHIETRVDEYRSTIDAQFFVWQRPVAGLAGIDLLDRITT